MGALSHRGIIASARKVIYLVLLVNLSVCHPDYLKSNERIYMKPSAEVCFGPRNNRLYFGDDLDTGSGLRSRSVT